MKITEKMLNDILAEKRIKTVFQPIVSLRDGSVFGYEALSRITDYDFSPSIEELFVLAEQLSKVWEIELLCRSVALKTAYTKFAPPYFKKLFLNVNPNIIHDKNFKHGLTIDFLKQFNITPDKIVFEVTEKTAIKDMSSFLMTIANYKEQNYKIAIDDAGAGYSGLNLISDIKPHFIKLDMKLVRNIDTDSIKYAIVKSMVELSHISNISLIAEGVETFEELKTLINLGVQFGQGYFIQRPDENIKDIDVDIVNEIIDLNWRKNHTSGRQASSIFIENLCSPAITVAPNVTVEQVYNILCKNKAYQGICIIDNDEVVGVIMRINIIILMSGRYGFALYQNKPISAIMDKNFLCVDYETPISTVSHIATLRNQDSMYDFIVITKNNKLLGTVSIKDILQKITEVDIQNAKNQNPLTELPGNKIIEQHLKDCLEKQQNKSVIYIDIDNFKAYNDVYGFEKGDMVIKFVSQLLKEYISENVFVGHIGGDDFVVISNFEEAENICSELLHNFKDGIMNLYSEADYSRGYIVTKNRKGVVEQCPLLSLTICGVKNAYCYYDNVISLTEKLAKLKKKLKQKGGNNYILE